MDQADVAIRKTLARLSSLWSSGPSSSSFFVNESPQLPTKVAKPFEKTYRVQGLPLGIDEAGLNKILQEHYKLKNEKDHESFNIGSLAESPDGRTLVATISFYREPSKLLASHNDKFKISAPDSQAQNPRPHTLTIEDEFLGLTTLYYPEEKNHKVEYEKIPRSDDGM